MNSIRGLTRHVLILLALSLPILPSCMKARVLLSQSSLGQALISVGGDHACAITQQGELRCWGNNTSGFLKSPSPTASPFSLPPSTYDSGVTYTTVSSGGSHHCGITTSGVLKCWGNNKNGQVGIGEPSGVLMVVPTPQVIDAATTYTKISAGGSHTCGLTSTGSMRCWGWNAYGQLGISISNLEQRAPVTVTGSDQFTSLAAGEKHTCALLDSGRVKCWGDNSYGQLGNGSSTTSFNTPQFTADTTQYTSVCAGGSHSCGVTVGGQIKCWGDNNNGQLGESTTTQFNVPTLVAGGITYTDVACGSNHTCAIDEQGRLFCWGANSSGQLGLGSTVDVWIPVVLPIHAKSSTLKFKAIDAGIASSCAINTEGSAFCWGRNNFGQLGDGTETESAVPVTADPSKTY